VVPLVARGTTFATFNNLRSGRKTLPSKGKGLVSAQHDDRPAMRTTKGAARHRAKKRVLRRAKGYRGGRGKLIRTAKETVLRAGAYAYRDRRVRKRDFRRLWIIRLNAAARQRGLSYSQLIAGLKRAGVGLDRKSLSEMAIHDPGAFDTIVALAREALGQTAAVS